MSALIHRRFQIFNKAARTATVNSEVYETYGARGLLLLLDIDAASGTTPTLDIKVQAEIPGGDFFDIPSAAFAQKSAAGQDVLEVYPSLVESANKKVSYVMPTRWRVVAAIGGSTPSFTFSLHGEALW